MTRFARALFRGRFVLLGLVVLASVPTGAWLQGLKADNTVDAFLSEEDPGPAFYRQTTAQFGTDNVAFVALKGAPGSALTLAGIQRIERVSAKLEAVEGVLEVVSLTRTDAVLGGAGSVRVGAFIEDVPEEDWEAEEIAEKVDASPLLQRLVSPDRGSALVAVELDEQLLAEPWKQTIVITQMRTALLEIEPAGAFALAGAPVTAEAVEGYNNRDQALFSALMLLLVALASILLLRRIGAGLLPVVVVLLTTTITLGLFVYAGYQTNWVTSMIAPLLVLVGVADAIHFLTHYRELLPHAASRREAVVETLRVVTPPCVLTSVTTAAGFASLMVNDVVPIRTFGVYTAVGVLIALLVTLAVIPAALSLGRGGARRPAAAAQPDRGPAVLLARALAALDRAVQRRPRTVLLGALAVVLPLAGGMALIEVETNIFKYFPPDVPVMVDARFIEETYGGASTLDIVVATPAKDGAHDPAVLRAVDAFQDRLEARPETTRGLSLADLVKELHRVITGDADRYSVPDEPNAIPQLLVFAGPDVTEGMVDVEARVLRIATRFTGTAMGLREARRMLDGIEADLVELMPEGVEARLTGSSLLFINQDEPIVTGQIQSFSIVLAILTVLMILVFRSFRIGLVAMIPNVMPIAVMLGLLGWLGMALDGFTAMMASVAIGIGVDDTIHFMHHLRAELRRGATLSEAITATLTGVGRALTFTSVVLALGFGVFMLATFLGTVHLGFLAAVAVVSALLADLLVLPGVLLLVGVPKSWLAGSGPSKE